VKGPLPPSSDGKDPFTPFPGPATRRAVRDRHQESVPGRPEVRGPGHQPPVDAVAGRRHRAHRRVRHRPRPDPPPLRGRLTYRVSS